MSEEVLDKPKVGERPIPLTRFNGAITGLYGDVLQGWAFDTTLPDHRLVIEIHIDGACVALARADEFEPNIQAGDGFHGFGIQLRQRWLENARHITARVANQDHWLTGDLSLPTSPAKNSAPSASQVWHTGGLRLSGWAWDPQAPQRHVNITVRERGTVVSQATADTHHQALVYRTTSDHGFSMDLPWSLADGNPHVLDVENDLGQPLSGSPITLCCWPEGLEGLLNELGPACDAKTKALIIEVAKEQTLRLPKSAGWQHYPQWFDVFQNPPEKSLVQGKVGLLLISEGDTLLEEISLRSVEPSACTIHDVAKASMNDLLPALKQLLDANCDSILPLMAGDRLGPHALAHLSTLLNEGVAWAFADCDRDNAQGERSLPWFKPAWDIDLFIGADVFTAGAIFSTDIVKMALKILSAIEKSPLDWHLLIAGIALATEKAEAEVVHSQQVLYHRGFKRVASPERETPCPNRYRAISWLCQQLATGTHVTNIPAYPALLRAHWPLPERPPKVTLIVPTRDQVKLLRTCIEGLLTATDYPDMEIIVMDNQSSDTDTINYLEKLPARGVRVIPHPYPFNYSTINNCAVAEANGELIGLVNNDIEIIDRNWLKEMVSQMRPGVGAVGAKLLWPNRMVQHAGVVVGINGLAAHTGNTWAENDAGYLGYNQLSRRQSAVTAACLLTSKATYLKVDGLDEETFPVAFNDVDFCLRVQELGLKIVWTPFAKLIHAESASRGKDESKEKKARAAREQQGFIERWALNGWRDIHYHPSLSHDYLSGPYGGLALPPLTKSRV